MIVITALEYTKMMINHLIVLIFLVGCTCMDLKKNIVYNEWNLLFLIIASIYLIVFKENGLFIFSIRLAISFIVAFITHLFRLFPPGDLKVFIVLTIFLGFKQVFYLLGFSLVFAALFSLILILRQKKVENLYKVFSYIKKVAVIKKIVAYDHSNSIQFPLMPFVFIGYFALIVKLNMV